MRRLCIGLLTVACVGTGLARGASAADPPTKKTEKTVVTPGVEKASLAAQLALEGEKKKSPLLLLAAAELLAGARESAQSLDKVKVKAPSSESSKQPLQLTVRELLKKAQQLAEADPALQALVQQRLEKASTRGLIFEQGQGKESVTVEGATFKVIYAGVMKPNDVLELSNVIFEGGEPAVIAVVGDGDGDLDLMVRDGNNDGLIGVDEDDTSVCLLGWKPKLEGPYTVFVKNVGKAAEAMVVLANW